MALRILDGETRAALEKNPRHFEEDPSAPYLRAILAVRSRIAEDAVARAAERGVPQYVVLGAGLDTFAYRNAYPKLKVFEVDHPATQEWKRGRLEDGGIAEPGTVTYVPVDFARQSLADELVKTGFDARAGAQFSWLGVTPYVSKDVARETLSLAGSLAGSAGGIVLDYVLPPETQPPFIQAAIAARRQKLKEIGEPWDSFYMPEEMAEMLRTAGFERIDDWGIEELNQRYFAGRSDGLMVGPVGRVVGAT
jgi:methyltransferase (TIGR00027 family)